MNHIDQFGQDVSLQLMASKIEAGQRIKQYNLDLIEGSKDHQNTTEIVNEREPEVEKPDELFSENVFRNLGSILGSRAKDIL